MYEEVRSMKFDEYLIPLFILHPLYKWTGSLSVYPLQMRSYHPYKSVIQKSRTFATMPKSKRIIELADSNEVSKKAFNFFFWKR